jgi:hypothetical protein
MSLDLQEIANCITADTPQGAAATLARLCAHVLDALPTTTGRNAFVAKWRTEMAKLGFRVERDPRLVRFRDLGVGDECRTLDGRRFRKIDPISYYDFRDQMTILLEAYDLEHNRPAYLPGGEVVEKCERSVL